MVLQFSLEYVSKKTETLHDWNNALFSVFEKSESMQFIFSLIII